MSIVDYEPFVLGEVLPDGTVVESASQRWYPAQVTLAEVSQVAPLRVSTLGDETYSVHLQTSGVTLAVDDVGLLLRVGRCRVFLAVTAPSTEG